MKKLFFLIFFIFGIAGIIFGTTVLHGEKNSAVTRQVLPAHTSTIPKRIVSPQSAQSADPDIPEMLRIPKIGVDASIESVGMDAKGRMDVPKNADNVAWFSIGYKPGNVGNAVIAGHFDKENGSPAVFGRLDELTKGDHVIIMDKKGQEITFSVIRTAAYPYDNFPLQEVFGTSSRPKLNFITCHGQWDKNAKNYSQRTVVYTEMIE